MDAYDKWLEETGQADPFAVSGASAQVMDLSQPPPVPTPTPIEVPQSDAYDAWLEETGQQDPFADAPVGPPPQIANDPGLNTGGTTIVPKGLAPRAPTVQETSDLIPTPSFGNVAVKEGFTRYADNAIGLGNMLLNSNPFNYPDVSKKGLAERRPSEGIIPKFDTIAAAARTIPKLPDIVDDRGIMGAWEEFKAQAAKDEYLTKAGRDKRPGAQAVGRTGGDIASILSGRAPFVKSAARAVPAVVKTMPVGTKRAAQRWFAGPKMQRLARGAGHAGTVGFEEALLSAAQDGSPGTAALLASAGQGAGSLALSIGKLPNSLAKIAGVGIGLTALIQLGKEATPGGKNYILESGESAYQKMLYGAALAAVAGLGGSGRLSARHGYKIGQDIPILADAITGIPRAAAQSIIAQATNEGQSGDNRIERTLTELGTNPGVFTDKERGTIERGIKSGDLSGALDTLSKDAGFQEKLRAMR